MGQENSISAKNDFFEYKNKINNSKISKSFFEFLYVIGRGGFGKVWKVRHKQTSKQYALKEMSKLKIIDKKSVKSIKTEREFLSILNHPFLVNMIYSFQDSDNLCLVMDLFLGGDLRYHICHKKRFDEVQSKFFCACVILGLEYIHKNNIIHRDIKPENLVLDEKGYLAITDFGIAKKNKNDNSSETSGTPGYMAPEVLCAQNHSFTADYFAVGVMCFEFLKGHRPYLGRNRQEIKEAVLAKQAHVHRKDVFENGWSLDAGNFINKMLYRKPSKRLGCEGINEIKECSWFKNFNWDDLLQKKITSPYIPKYGDNFDKKYCEAKENIDKETIERYQIYRNKGSFKNIFQNYTFIREENEEKENNKIIEKSQNHNTSSSTKSSTGNNNININYHYINKYDEKENKINNDINEISEEIKNPIELYDSSKYKNRIDQFINKNKIRSKFENIYNNEGNRYLKNIEMKKNKINNNISLKNNEYYNIKNIAKYFEEPINEFDNNYISIKNNNINIFNNYNFENNENNNNNKNNDSSNHMDVNDETNENEQNNTIYNLKNEKKNNIEEEEENNNIKKENILLEIEGDINKNNNNNSNNNNKVRQNKQNEKELKVNNKLYNFNINNNPNNNIIVLVKSNKTPNNNGKDIFNIKDKNNSKNKISNNINMFKNKKNNKNKSTVSNNEDINKQNKRISSLSQNRTIKKTKNNNPSMKKGKTSKLSSSKKMDKNNLTDNKFYSQKDFNSHSRSQKTNGNKTGLVVSLSNNINIKSNYNSYKISSNKNQKDYTLNYNNNQSKNLNYNNNINNYNLIYNYNVPLHSSKNYKTTQIKPDIEKKKNFYYNNSKITNQNKRVISNMKKENIIIKKNNNNDNMKDFEKGKKIEINENEVNKFNSNNNNSHKEKIIYKVSSMKFLKSINYNNNDISNNSTKKINKTNNGKSDNSLNNKRSQTGKINQKTKIINNILQNSKGKKNITVKTYI